MGNMTPRTPSPRPARRASLSVLIGDAADASYIAGETDMGEVVVVLVIEPADLDRAFAVAAALDDDEDDDRETDPADAEPSLGWANEGSQAVLATGEDDREDQAEDWVYGEDPNYTAAVAAALVRPRQSRRGQSRL